MYRQNNELVYSPSDLNAFLDNECVTWLSRFNLEYPGELTANEAAEEDVLIQGAGDEHERTYLAGLVANGADVVVIDREDRDAFLLTMEAMRGGREIIYQARLELNDSQAGRTSSSGSTVLPNWGHGITRYGTPNCRAA
jgi:hypothetical protein